MALTAEEKNYVLKFLHREYAELIIHAVEEKKNKKIKVEHFEEVLDNNPILEDFYITLNGYEKIKDLRSKKSEIQAMIQKFVRQILKGFKIATDKSLGDIKDNIRLALGEREALRLFNKLIFNENGYPVKGLPQINENLLFDIDAIDIFLQLDKQVLEKNAIARETRAYFMKSFTFTITNSNSINIEEPIKPQVTPSFINNSNNNSTTESSYTPRYFAPQKKQTGFDEFPSSGVLDINDSTKFEMAVIKENSVTINGLLHLILNYGTVDQVSELLTKNSQALKQKDRFGNNAVHIAAMSSNDNGVEIIKVLSKKDSTLSNQVNNYGLKPFSLSIMFNNEKVSHHFIASRHSSVLENAPLKINNRGGFSFGK